MVSAARRYGSAKDVRSSMKGGGGGGNGVLKKLDADQTLKVRFLQGPGDWYEALYHWVNGKFRWCPQTKACPGCRLGDRPRKIALANAVDLVAGKVIVVQLPPTLADPLAARAEKLEERGRSITDHDIDLIREGSTKENTKYIFDPDDMRKRNLTRWDNSLHNILEIVQSEIEFQAQMDEREANAKEDSPRSTKKSKASKKSRDEDEYEDEVPDEEEDEAPRRTVKVKPKKDKYEGLNEFKPKRTTTTGTKPRAVVRRPR